VEAAVTCVLGRGVSTQTHAVSTQTHTVSSDDPAQAVPSMSAGQRPSKTTVDTMANGNPRDPQYSDIAAVLKPQKTCT
jgi:hypothetical protein